MHREIHDLAYFSGVRLAQVTADNGEVLTVDVYDAPVHRAVARDDAVARKYGMLHAEIRAPVLHELVKLHETARVEYLGYPLAGRELALFALRGDGFLPASLRRFLAASEQIFAELIDSTIRHACFILLHASR